MMTERSDGSEGESPSLTFPELSNSITNLDEERWEAQKDLNDRFAWEITDQSSYLVRTMDSLGRAWTKIGALWVFAAGGYITGLAGIVLAVVR